MKKTAAFVILSLFVVLLWSAFAYSGDMVFDFDGDRIDGPFGALLAMLFAGGGTLLAGMIMLLVGAILAVVFAGVGIVLVGAIGLAALVLALAISPLLLPALVPLAVIWYLVGRSRKHRMIRQQAV
jgi:hypothetical protein